ncbi:MAG TPA: Mur ligase family protein, partial [Candidatus Acidoferrales bacterium]|nr:Mur ligase family protein [Candidatus Acidoferrales bacterium]
TERARIDGIAVSERRFADILAGMMPAIEAVAPEHGRPTYYETLLALAFEYFAQERVDVAVIEVGLGGRLDGTNVIVPVIAAITSVGRDHTEVLGDTIEAIALEKAGIAKPGVALVLGAMPPEAAETIQRRADEVGAPVVRAGEVTAIGGVRFDAQSGGQTFEIVTQRARYDISTTVLGEFQRSNAATAIAVLERLPADLRPSVENIEKGFSDVVIPGRFEVFRAHPSVVFDIAHNAEKAQHLAASLAEAFPGRRIHYVVAIGEDKDAREILSELAAGAATFTFTTFKTEGRNPARPQKLALIAEAIGRWGRVIQHPVDALEAVRRSAGSEDVVVVTGSTFVVAELRGWWIEQGVVPVRR